jgi:DMSO/TMAO reductase YedYZ molybdopterin-dependent catalytic subunit
MLSLLFMVALAADPTREVKVLATGFWRAQGGTNAPAQQLILRSAAEAARALGQAPDGKGQQLANQTLTKAFKVDKIDWDKQMVVVVTAGSKPSGGYRLEIKGLVVKDNTLTVQWVLHPPTGFATQAFTHPAQAALVTAFAGKVVFDPPPPKGGRNEK